MIAVGLVGCNSQSEMDRAILFILTLLEIPLLRFMSVDVAVNDQYRKGDYILD